ncbi:MAG: hypothetical protein ACRDHG_00905, partial [Anaerolineales bacterium]
MTQDQEITQFNRMLDIALGIGETRGKANDEQLLGIQELLEVAAILAEADFQDELRPALMPRKQLGGKARAISFGRGLLPRRRAEFVLLAVLALMVAALLAIGPEKALAALRGLLGYIPGIGLVDDSTG